MNNLPKRFFNRITNRLSLRMRLILYLLILVIFITTFITYGVYNKSNKVLTHRVNLSIEKNFELLTVNLLQRFETLNDIATKIYVNDYVQTILSNQHPYRYKSILVSDLTKLADDTSMINEIITLGQILDNYRFSNIIQTPIHPTIYVFNRPEYLKYNINNNVKDHRDVENKDWFLTVPAYGNFKVIGIVDDSPLGKPYVMSMAKRLYGFKQADLPYAGLLTIDFDIINICNTLNDLKETENTIIYIIDSSGTIQLSNQLTQIGETTKSLPYTEKILNSTQPFGSFTTSIDKINMFIYYKKMPTLDWTIISTSPIVELHHDLTEIKKVQIFILVIGLILSLFFAWLLANDIATPINKLIKYMSIASEGEFNIAIKYKRIDEFSILIKQFNTMLTRIKDLIDKLYISEVNKKQAELNALQSQINPHFLYNTLDSIHLLALNSNVPEISDIVIALSDFYRYSLSSGRNIITLKVEKKQIESYLAIQKIRFKDQLEFTVDFNPNVYSYLTAKLILQPLVENAIIHGIQLKTDHFPGSIHISAAKFENTIKISVEDNGVGANVEELNYLIKTNVSGKNSLGIRNVQERINQYFGDSFGIEYTSNDLGGLTAIITLPAVMNMEEFDVKNGNSR